MVFSPFIQDSSTLPVQPLARFMPPLPQSMVQKWVGGKLPRGAWVLDPFGSSPAMILDLAKAGYRVLVTANNPISAFLIETMADFPGLDETRDILSKLTTAIFNTQTIEEFIRGFYRVTCTECGKSMEASAFLWRKDDANPFGFLGECPTCGYSGEQQLTNEGKASLQPISAYQFHRAWALESIVALDDPQREQVESALNCYLPRTIVILQTLLLKLSMLSLSPRQLSTLQALLLSTFDQSNALWSYPPLTTRRRQLTIPSIYKENNIWLALIGAVDVWASRQTRIICRLWPEHPPLSGGISLFKGKLRDLEPLPDMEMLDAVVTIPPRPNQAFWTLSAVWAGWLWGKHSVLPIKQALSRQRYDWNWHTNALRSTLQPLQTLIGMTKPIFQIIAENEPSFLAADLFASRSAGLDLQSIASSGNADIIQSLWTKSDEPIETPDQQDYLRVGRNAAIEYLLTCAEPVLFEPLQASILTALSQKGYLGDTTDKKLELPLTETFRQIETILLDKDYFTRYNSSASSLDVGFYGLSSPEKIASESLSDRVEKEVVNILHQFGQLSLQEIRMAINEQFPGFQTPSDDLVMAILNSYAQQLSGKDSYWTLKPSEMSKKRLLDIQEINSKVITIGKTLRFAVSESDNNIVWTDDKLDLSYAIFITDSARLSQICHEENANQNQIVILPGSRANLLAFKQKHNPQLETIIKEHFSIVKFRQLRSIFENPLLTRELWDILIKEDPPEWSASQMALL